MRRFLDNISDRDVLLILLGFFIGAVTISLVAHFQAGEINLLAWLDSFAQNFGTEMFGAILTFLLIEVLVSRRREHDATEKSEHALKAQLMRRLSSQDNNAVKRAAEELRANGWLSDGSLNHIKIWDADLQDVNLDEASMKHAVFGRSSLKQTNLANGDFYRAWFWNANLQQALLSNSNFSQANLAYANLNHAQLIVSNLQYAILKGADLRGAILFHSYLVGADLSGTLMDEETTLPDGTRWDPDTDMRRFTDPEHPQFWQPEKPFPGRFGAESASVVVLPNQR